MENRPNTFADKCAVLGLEITGALDYLNIMVVMAQPDKSPSPAPPLFAMGCRVGKGKEDALQSWISD